MEVVVIAGIIICLIVLIIHFLPTIIAIRRRKKNALAIFVLNLFLGWTMIGWVVALIWAVMYEKQDDKRDS